ncbi:MAG: pyridoxal phosphate-dependent aminotransferase [Saprospiraceae bacterium]|nr:pyridoxal phosphate-dependent aminotransferase [Saprospiraceae bacterium]
MVKVDTPIDYDLVQRIIKENNIADIGKASIRVIKKLVDDIEKETGEKFIRMEMGIPGLPANQIGVAAEIEALKNGVAAIYPDVHGHPELKKEISRFVKLFLDIDVSETGCIPTVGSMQAGFASFLTISRLNKQKDTTLFIDPGFAVHKMQHQVLGQKYETFDVYNYRGEKLRDKLESYLKKGNISSILYSNPNNPSWICFTDGELQIIGELATKYDVIVLEDLAYFGMDFRRDMGKPGFPPFQPSVAKYTGNWVLFISSSKVFSYAGQRIGMMVISDHLFNTQSPELKNYYASDIFGYAMIFGTVYALSSGTSHSAQYALAAMLKAVNNGEFNFREVVLEYGAKAKIMKKLFTDNGFNIVYDYDIDKPIADGFYFTVSYPGFTGGQLLCELLTYGISAISLAITGSERVEGIRACVSLVKRDQFPVLEERLIKFNKNHLI